MLVKRLLVVRFMLPLLVILTMAAVAIPTGAGTSTVSADSRCDQHYSHTHGSWFWKRTDAYSSHGNWWGPHGYITHWADHENSTFDWCS